MTFNRRMLWWPESNLMSKHELWIPHNDCQSTVFQSLVGGKEIPRISPNIRSFSNWVKYWESVSESVNVTGRGSCSLNKVWNVTICTQACWQVFIFRIPGPTLTPRGLLATHSTLKTMSPQDSQHISHYILQSSFLGLSSQLHLKILFLRARLQIESPTSCL